MKRVRKVAIVVSLAVALTAAQAAPASAGPVEQAVCDVTTELSKYHWGAMPVCL